MADPRDPIDPIEEERAGYRQIVGVLAVIIVALFMLMLLYFYFRTPVATSTVVRETTIQSVPGSETQPPSTSQTTTIRETTTGTPPVTP
jgi:hypothetical protein